MTKFPRTEVQSFVNRCENPWVSKVSSISKWLNTNTYRGRRVSRLCLGLSRESNTSTGFQVMIFIPSARWASRRMIERERKPYGRRGTRFKRGHEKKTSHGGEKWEFFFPPRIREIYSWFKLDWKGGNGSGERLVAIEEVRWMKWSSIIRVDRCHAWVEYMCWCLSMELLIRLRGW